MGIFNNIFLYLYRIIVNLEDNDCVVENLKRIKRISKINLILLVLSIPFVVIGTLYSVFCWLWNDLETVYPTLFSLMFLGLIFIIISRILIKKTNPNQSESKIEKMQIIIVLTGIIGFCLVVVFFIVIVNMFNRNCTFG